MSADNIDEWNFLETDEIEWMDADGPVWFDDVTGSVTRRLYDRPGTSVEWTSSRDPEPSSVRNTAYPVTNESRSEIYNLLRPHEEMIYQGPNLVYVTPREKSRMLWEWRMAKQRLKASNPNNPEHQFKVEDEANKRIKEIDPMDPRIKWEEQKIREQLRRKWHSLHREVQNIPDEVWTRWEYMTRWELLKELDKLGPI